MDVQYMTSSQLKTRAKDLLEGRFGSAVLIIFLGGIITATLNMISNSFVSLLLLGLDLSPVAVVILSLSVSALVSLFTNIFSAGYALFFLNIACKRSCDVGCLFYGFREQFGKCMSLSAFFTIVSFVLFLPCQICNGMFGQTKETGWMMAALLFGSIALTASTIFSLVFSQCYFLLLDFPDYTAKQLLQSSARIMRGHKGHLFYLQVSFIPLILLAVLTCGIGILWLSPYIQMTYTCFFLDIMNPLTRKG